MSNQFYNHSTFPVTGSAATSQSMRAELDLIAAGFDKMPGLTGNNNKLVAINGTATGLTVISTSAQLAAAISDETGTGSLVFGTGPTLTNPTINGGSYAPTTFTFPAGTGSTTEGVVMWDPSTDLLLIGTGSATKTLVDTNSSQALTGKTISGATNTLTNIGNGSLTNSSVTIGSTSLSLGGTLTSLAGVTISGATNTLTNIGNGSLTNSSITINGSSVSLGGSVTVTATTTNALTIGTGLSGTSYNGSSAVTIAIDSSVVTLTGSQVLTNKTISGATNTLTNIGNGSLTNSSVTIGSTSLSLGGTLTSLAGVTISGATNTLTNIGNGSLTNNSVTIGSTSISLGSTATTLAGLSSVTSTSFVGALTGNADTATTLANTRTIWGQNFNGSANVSGALSGVTDITASGSVTLSGGTANGVAYLNGSKVLTTGSALTFDGANLGIGVNPVSYLSKVATNGNLSLAQGGKQYFWDATDSSGTYIYNANNSSIAFGIYGGSEQMRLTSTGLGIGGTTPNSKLKVYVQTDGDGILLDQNGTTRLSLTADTTNLSAKVSSGNVFLDLESSNASSRGIRFFTGATSTERMRIDSSGNLGLGVTPSAWGGAVPAIQNKNGAIYGTSSTETGYTSNAYYGSGGWTYITSAQASYYRQLTGQHQWYTAPSGTAGNAISFTQALTLTANGNLGVGTSSPIAFGAGYVNAQVNGTTGSFLNLSVNGTRTGYMYADVNGVELGSVTNTYTRFMTNNTERMRIDSSGNLGLGVTPSAWGGGFVANQVKGASMWTDGNTRSFWSTNLYFDGSNRRYISSNPAFEYSQTSTGHTWLTAPSGTAGNAISFTQAMTLDASGNLGIGTSSPSSQYSTANQLVIGANSGNLGMTIAAGASSQGSIFFSKGTATDAQKAAGYIYYLNTSDYMAFGTANTERMRIDSSGNLLVGTTSAFNSCKVGIQASAAAYNILSIQNTVSTVGTYIGLLNSSGTSAGYIAQTGTTTVQYATSSDYRLKENIQPMQNALATVAQLNPVTYTWKADGSDGQGFIAHELQAVVPDCVTGEKDAVDKDGNPVYQGIDTSFLVATLTKAIQELKAELDATKTEVAALKAIN